MLIKCLSEFIKGVGEYAYNTLTRSDDERPRELGGKIPPEKVVIKGIDEDDFDENNYVIVKTTED